MRRPRASPKAPRVTPRVAGTRADVPLVEAKPRQSPPPLPVSDARLCDEFVIQMHGVGMSITQMMEEGPKHIPAFSPAEVERAFGRYCRQLGQLAKLHDVAARRALAVEDTRRTIVRLRVRQAQTFSTALENTIQRYIAFLSTLEGTQMPIEVDIAVAVDVRVQNAAMRVLGGEVTADHWDSLVDEQRRLESITVSGHEVK